MILLPASSILINHRHSLTLSLSSNKNGRIEHIVTISSSSSSSRMIHRSIILGKSIPVRISWRAIQSRFYCPSSSSSGGAGRFDRGENVDTESQTDSNKQGHRPHKMNVLEEDSDPVKEDFTEQLGRDRQFTYRREKLIDEEEQRRRPRGSRRK